MRVAAIDLGTNTFHLLIAETQELDFNILYKTNAPVRLGEGKLNDNIIIDAAFVRGLDQLTEFAEKLKEYRVDVVKATGTSAIRSAKNGRAFVEAVYEKTGITIDVISGDEEAALIYEGVKASGAIEGISMIMDIGGGSTEFIICDQQQVLWKKSYDVGAARLLQGFFHSDPLSKTDKTVIDKHLDHLFTDLKQMTETHQPAILIGSAGAFETFAGMINPDLNLKDIKSTSIDLEGYKSLAETFLKSTHQQRVNMPGLIPLRVDMIVMAVLITNYVLGFSKIQKINLSTYDLKMGVLATLISIHQANFNNS